MSTKPTAPDGVPKPAAQRTPDRYILGDPIPVPEASEANTDSTWAMLSDVPRQPEPEFLETVPAAMLDEELAAKLREKTQ